MAAQAIFLHLMLQSSRALRSRSAVQVLLRVSSLATNVEKIYLSGASKAHTTHDMLHLFHHWLLPGIKCWLAMQRSEEGRDGQDGAHSSESAGEDEYEFAGAQALEFLWGHGLS